MKDKSLVFKVIVECSICESIMEHIEFPIPGVYADLGAMKNFKTEVKMPGGCCRKCMEEQKKQAYSAGFDGAEEGIKSRKILTERVNLYNQVAKQYLGDTISLAPSEVTYTGDIKKHLEVYEKQEYTRFFDCLIKALGYVKNQEKVKLWILENWEKSQVCTKSRLLVQENPYYPEKNTMIIKSIIKDFSKYHVISQLEVIAKLILAT